MVQQTEILCPPRTPAWHSTWYYSRKKMKILHSFRPLEILSIPSFGDPLYPLLTLKSKAWRWSGSDLGSRLTARTEWLSEPKAIAPQISCGGPPPRIYTSLMWSSDNGLEPVVCESKRSSHANKKITTKPALCIFFLSF
jgi:hypothetical protein